MKPASCRIAGALVLAASCAAATAQISPNCPGDANGDALVDFNDLNLVLANWNTPGPGGDVDGSGFVDFDDLNLVLANWGLRCVRIDDFSPRAGGTLTRVTITGAGFDPNPDNNCAVVMMGACSLPLQVLDVSPDGTEMTVEVGPVWGQAQPGPIMVGRGLGAFGTFDPIFPDIEVVEPVWIWDRTPGAPMDDTADLPDPFFDPVPPPQELWLHGEPENGVICLIIPDTVVWGPDQKMSLVVRAHDHAQGIGHDGYFPCMRILGPGGDTLACADRICDMIQCAFFQQSGIVIDCSISVVPGGVKITISLPGGNIDWGNFDLCLEPGPVQITGFEPVEVQSGDLITIFGSGFDPDPDNNCAVVMMGQCSLPLQVVGASADGRQLTAQVGPIWQGAQPGPIMVGRGVGARGFFDPIFPDIVVEEPVWNWDRLPRNGPADDTADLPGGIVIPIPPPTEQWIHGEPENGVICVVIPDDLPWGPDQKFNMTVRAHDHTLGIGHDGWFPCMRIIGPGGSAAECAERICDTIRCSFFQQAGFHIECFTTPVPGGTKITIAIPGGHIDWGNVDICLLPG